MSLQVCEVFYSIQGESARAGCPCVFVRLAGCNLHCSYCDTLYARTGGEERSVDEIVAAVGMYPCRLVEITGGEPLVQKQTPRLVSGLLNTGYCVLLETNGTLVPEGIDSRCVKIVDVKCPSSGEMHRFNPAVLAALTPRDELKFVISDRGDFEFARAFLSRLAGISLAAIHFSPVMTRLSASDLAAWILADGLNVRCTPQLHRLIWPDEERGV